MEHTLTVSSDGSSTLKLTNFEETYHSINGACSEAMHIYIENGLQYLHSNGFKNIRVYDIGLGSALNCLLGILWLKSLQDNTTIRYVGIEKYPLDITEIKQLNFPEHITTQLPHLLPSERTANEIENLFLKIHQAPWEEDIEIISGFILHKTKGDIITYSPHPDNLSFSSSLSPGAATTATAIFYDTFSPATQPELWGKEIFHRFYNAIEKGSVLVTYCSKGSVKEGLREAGFFVKRLKGANGKRHMVRGEKL